MKINIKVEKILAYINILTNENITDAEKITAICNLFDPECKRIITYTENIPERARNQLAIKVAQTLSNLPNKNK